MKLDDRVELAIQSFNNFNQGNTRVVVVVEDTHAHGTSRHVSYETRVYLHGNLIAYHVTTKDNSNGEIIRDAVTLTHAGWKTPTTKRRLNAVCEALALPRVYQENFEFRQGDLVLEPSITWKKDYTTPRDGREAWQPVG